MHAGHDWLIVCTGIKGVTRPLMLLHRTRATMAAFVTSLQAYVMTEVMEAEWAGFAQQLGSTPNMDEFVGERARAVISSGGMSNS